MRSTIDARPKQVMGYLMDSRRKGNNMNGKLESTYTSSIEHGVLPSGVSMIFDREFLTRTTHKRLDDGSFRIVRYSILDERLPLGTKRVRVDTFSCSIVRAEPGSGGKRTEVVQATRTDFKFWRAFSFMSESHSPTRRIDIAR